MSIQDLLEKEIVDSALKGDTTVLAELLTNLNYPTLYNALSDEGQRFIDNQNHKFVIGDNVEVPEPNDDDLHQHSFVGYLKSFRNSYAVVEDCDGDCFCIEVDRLTKV